MTLKQVPRYKVAESGRVGSHAVVLGAGIAGLCAARVLSDCFDEVTVVDRDRMPEDPVKRDGTPQAGQPHALLEAGRATLEDFFPGFGEDLLANGGLMVDGTSDMDYFYDGDYLTDGRERQPMYCASRPLIEQTVREATSSLDNVDLRQEHRFIDFRTSESCDRVTGVTVEQSGGKRIDLESDVVVDATGRASKTPDWLVDNGFERPETMEVPVEVNYSTVVVDRPPESRRLVFVPPSPPRTRGGAALPIEDDRWIVTLQGIHGDAPPADPDEMVDFAATLPTPVLKRILTERSWKSEDVDYYPFPSSLRRHYETLEEFPNGLLVVGDAHVSFNPLYGQGMSVATLEALALHHALTSDRDEPLYEAYFDRALDVVDPAWELSVSTDRSFSEAEGSVSLGTSLFNWYVDRMLTRAHDDGALTDAYSSVLHLERPPTSLLRPSVLSRTLLH